MLRGQFISFNTIKSIKVYLFVMLRSPQFISDPTSQTFIRSAGNIHFVLAINNKAAGGIRIKSSRRYSD